MIDGQSINDKLKTLTRAQSNELADHLNDAYNRAIIARAGPSVQTQKSRNTKLSSEFQIEKEGEKP